MSIENFIEKGPNFGFPTDEPSISYLIYWYYYSNFGNDADKADRFTEKYLNSILDTK